MLRKTTHSRRYLRGEAVPEHMHASTKTMAESKEINAAAVGDHVCVEPHYNKHGIVDKLNGYNYIRSECFIFQMRRKDFDKSF